jgi:hypothetical protein
MSAKAKIRSPRWSFRAERQARAIGGHPGVILSPICRLKVRGTSTDIVAVARAVQAGQSPARAGLYWNASCLREIGFPNFWPKETLEPALLKYTEDHPVPRSEPLPLCSEQYVRLGD